MALKHPEYAHGISDEELIKEALEFCDEELSGFNGMEYDSDSEVCCQRSETFIRELVVRARRLKEIEWSVKRLAYVVRKSVNSGPLSIDPTAEANAWRAVRLALGEGYDEKGNLVPVLK